MTSVGDKFTETLLAGLQGYKDTFGNLDDLPDVAHTLARSLFLSWGQAQVDYLTGIMGSYHIDQAADGQAALVHMPCSSAAIVPFPVDAASIVGSVVDHTPECPAFTGIGDDE